MASPGCSRVHNPIVGLTPFCHNPVFSNFTQFILENASQLAWSDGKYNVRNARPGRASFTSASVVVDWLGVRAPRAAYCHDSYYRQRVAHALRSQLCDFLEWTTERPDLLPLPLPLPVASEEYFEYIDVLEAVVDYYRSTLSLVRHGKERDVRPFTMLEIGAGFGFWTLTTHAALRQLWKTRHSDLPGRRLPPLRYNYTLVEIDHAKQDLLQTVLAMNAIDARHASVVHAALGLRDEAEGAVQDGIAGWYAVYSCDTHSSGGACAQKGFNVPKHKRANRTVLAQQKGAVADMVSLPTLLRPYTIVDLVDMDVQAAEFKVLNGSAGAHDAKRALDALDEKVLRVHIGTHDKWDDRRRLKLTKKERALTRPFLERGWRASWMMGATDGLCNNERDFRPGPWGPVCMADGALSFVNERLRERLRS